MWPQTESNRRSEKRIRVVATYPVNALKDLYAASLLFESHSSPIIANCVGSGGCQDQRGQHFDVCLTERSRGKHRQSECSLQTNECLSPAAEFLEIVERNHSSKLCKLCSKRWLHARGQCTGLADPSCSAAQPRLSTRFAIISGSATGSFKELLGTESHALMSLSDDSSYHVGRL